MPLTSIILNSDLKSSPKPIQLEIALKPLLKEGIIIFCGAGISIPPPSCSPSWWTLTEEILEAFFNRVPNEYLPPEMEIKDPNRQPEEVFETFASILDNKLYKAFKALDVAEPNQTHVLIARLAKAGILKACFSTNFDIYLERALKKEGVEFDLLVDNMEYDKYFENFLKRVQQKIKSRKFLLCKIHGTIERPDSIISVASAYKSSKGFSTPKASVFESFLINYPCLFLGYSGKYKNGPLFKQPRELLQKCSIDFVEFTKVFK